MALVTLRQSFCPTLVISRLQAYHAVLLASNSFHVVTLLAAFFPPCFQLKIHWWFSFFSFVTSDWCERGKIIWWKRVCLLVPMQLLTGLKSWWIEGALWSFWNKQVLVIERLA